jgi:precorrin-6B methylase 1
MAVFGGIATTDLSTLQTHSEVNPGVSGLEALLATLGVRLNFLQMIFYVRALDCGHGILFRCNVSQALGKL